MLPGSIVSFVYGFRTGRKARVHTYADYLYVWTWIGFLIASIVLFIVRSSEMQNFALYMLILAGFPTFMSGIILRFKPLIAGGICFWIIALIVNFSGPVLSPLGMPVAVMFGYLIPGYILKNKIDHDKV
ncbi:MAG: hypothetical protein IPN68_18705 [Bacteroidetes bacterium]|nr:hypothetical protein [Bacteroidota bacterium]